MTLSRTSKLSHEERLLASGDHRRYQYRNTRGLVIERRNSTAVPAQSRRFKLQIPVAGCLPLTFHTHRNDLAVISRNIYLAGPIVLTRMNRRQEMTEHNGCSAGVRQSAAPPPTGSHRLYRHRWVTRRLCSARPPQPQVPKPRHLDTAGRNRNTPSFHRVRPWLLRHWIS